MSERREPRTFDIVWRPDECYLFTGNLPNDGLPYEMVQVREFLPGNVVLSAEEFERVRLAMVRDGVSVGEGVAILDAAKGKS